MDDKRVRVRDIMSTPLETISADASLTEAASVMRDNDINSLVVTTNPPSIITSTDIIGAVSEGHDPADLDVRDVMTESVETIPPTLYLGEAAAMMINFGINHLPVVDGGDYVGMISSTDTVSEWS